MSDVIFRLTHAGAGQARFQSLAAACKRAVADKSFAEELRSSVANAEDAGLPRSGMIAVLEEQARAMREAEAK